MPPPAIDPDVIATLRELDPDDDGFFREVVMTFLANTGPQLETLRRGWADRDPHAVERAAHKLKGGCAAMGANRLSRLCAQLEELARTAVLPESDADVLEILAEYDRCRAELEPLCSN
jgi:HPt (histidine-containing phosphotransfer) domain-containing protein